MNGAAASPLPSSLQTYIQISIVNDEADSIPRQLARALARVPQRRRQDAGYQLDKVQRGEQPDDFKPMPSIGKGVEELRVWDDTGTYRVVYTARLKDVVVVLHAFQKKTEATSKGDIEPARSRWAQLMQERWMKTVKTAKAARSPKAAAIDTYASVWDAIADTPEQAANLQARSELMRQIAALVRENRWTQTEAAQRCGVTQPRMNDLLRGRVSRFSLDALVNIATSIGRKVRLELEAA
jgi:phage-related protein/predicted XRE-type DNA-binding protein